MYSFDKYVKLCHELQDKKPTPVAEAAGVQRSLISRWKGGGGITDTSALKLAKYLGVPIEALKEEQKENPTSQKTGEVDGAVTKELFDMVYAATEEERRDMLEILRIYKRKETKKG